jgi:hypothetical protein
MPAKGYARWRASDTAIPGADGQANIRPQDAGPASAPQHRFPPHDGHVLLCTYGANLPCGKANSDRDLPGAEGLVPRPPERRLSPKIRNPVGQYL